MTKKEALAIFGLEHPANRQMIESRYARLIKGYHRADPEKMAQINEAYKALTEDTRKIEIPRRLQKEVAGKSLYQWKNFAYYARTPAIVSLLVLALISAIIYSVVTKQDPDFVIATIGSFYNREDNLLEEQEDLYTISDFVTEHMDVEKPLVDLLAMGGSQDPQMEVANMTKRILYAGGMSPADLFLLDEVNFLSMEIEGIFIPLDDFYAELQDRYSEEELSLIEPVYGHISLTDEERAERNASKTDSDNEETSSTELDDWISTELYMVGFDFSETQIFNALSMLGYQQILSIPVHNDDPSLAMEFIELLISEQDLIQTHSPGLVNPSPTPMPTPIPTALPSVSEVGD